MKRVVGLGSCAVGGEVGVSVVCANPSHGPDSASFTIPGGELVEVPSTAVYCPAARHLSPERS